MGNGWIGLAAGLVLGAIIFTPSGRKLAGAAAGKAGRSISGYSRAQAEKAATRLSR